MLQCLVYYLHIILQDHFWLLFLIDLQTALFMHKNNIHCNVNTLPSRDSLPEVAGFFLNDAA